MGVLIDATVPIAWERGGVDVGARIAGREDEPFYLSVITASELLYGVHWAADSGMRARRTAFVEGVLARFPLLSIDLATARLHAELWAQLAGQGRMIGAHDLWLAATAVAHSLSLATANVREFERVPGLVVENWTAG